MNILHSHKIFRCHIIITIAAFILAPIHSFAQDSLFLTRDRAAISWEEALPIGNGKLGAKVFGGAETDSILLIDQTLATEQNDCRMPFAKLIIKDKNKEASTYIKQSLNINRSLLTEEYKQNSLLISRECFASYPDRVIGIRIRCKNENSGEKASKINCIFELSSVHQESLETKDNHITLMGQANGTNGKIPFHTRLILNSTDGKIKSKDNTLEVKEASEITLYIINETATEAENSIKDEIELQTERLKMKDYDKIRFFHISDYRNIFARFVPQRKLTKEQFLEAAYSNYLFISWPSRK